MAQYDDYQAEEASPAVDQNAEKFEELGIFKRLGKMFKGLSMPRDSREYKEARIEVQRLSAPALAILLPTMFIVTLFIVTAVSAKPKEVIEVQVQEVQEEEPELEEIEPPPEVEPPPDVEVEVSVDVPTVGTPTEIASNVPVMSNEPQTPKVNQVDAMQAIQSPVVMKSVMGSSRSTGVRGQLTRGGAQYGDPSTEAAVMKALRWLKKNQQTSGAWPGQAAASTGLAILSFLAHGETPGSKEFGSTVQLGIEWLINAVMEQGGKVKMAGCDGHEYAFLIGTYALCEAYGMTKNPNARVAAELCLTRIVQNQSATGGWDYNINKESTRDDLSFEGWALQAVKAGKMAGIHVSGMEECIKKAIRCLKTRNFKNGGFNYTAGGNPTGLTATGCLCMQLLGFGREPEVASALDYMREWKPTFTASDLKGGGGAPQYYCYYASQCKYQAGMCKGAAPANLDAWKKWNVAMKQLYTTSIKTESGAYSWNGKDYDIGHWENTDAHSTRPVMDTCLCALQLMVYYRYLPTTSLAAAEVEADVQALTKDKGGEIGVVLDL